MNLGIECDPCELSRISQGAIDLSFEDRLEIDGPGGAINEVDAESIWPGLLERDNAVDWVCHRFILPQRSTRYLVRNSGVVEEFIKRLRSSLGDVFVNALENGAQAASRL